MATGKTIKASVHRRRPSRPAPEPPAEIETLRARIQELEATAAKSPETNNRPPEPTHILQSIVDGIADGVVVANEHGEFLLVNPAAEQMVGIGATSTPPGEWSQRYGCFLPDGVTPCPAEDLPLYRAIRGEDVNDREIFIRNERRPEGLLLSCNARPLRDEAGNIKGGIVTFRDVTERMREIAEHKRAEEALATEHNLLRTLIDNLPHPIFVKDTQSRFVVSNFACAGRLRESNPQNTIGKSDFDFLPRELAAPYFADEQEIIRTGTPILNKEYKVQNPDGTSHWFVSTKVPLRDKQGKIVGIVGVNRDITPQKLAEQEIRKLNTELEERAIEQETRYRLAAKATNDAIWDWDLITNEVQWNEGVQILFGYTAEEIGPDATWWSERVHEQDRERVLTGIHLAIDRGAKAWIDEYRFARRDGSYALVIDRGYVVRDASGKPTRMVGAMLDITERKRVQTELEHSLSLLEATLDSTADGILVVDPEGRIVSFNKKFVQMWRIPQSIIDARDDNVALAFVLDQLKDPQGFLSKVRELYNQPDAESHDILEFKDGKIFERDSQPRRLAGKSIGRVWSFRDITERERLQRQLLQSQKLESIGTLAGGIAHDFNNLLAVILGNASIHLRDRSLTPKLRDSLDDIVSAAERGSSLTHQLLVYARGGLQKPSPNDLWRLVESVVQILRRTVPPQIEFLLSLPADLPPIMADPSQIEQVIMNLCLNAIQASNPPNQVEISACVQTLDATHSVRLELQPGRYVCLKVRDYGCGMDPPTMARIFEPFFSTKFAGRGMGLAATLGIIQSHGGQIRVESRPLAGTTMSVWLPVAQEPAVSRPPARPKRPSRPPHGTETILVIDDDPAVTRTVEQVLLSLGYCVIAHTDVDDATAFLDTNAEDVNLVLLDLNMPKCSGAEMVKRISKRCPHAPIMLASGFEDPDLVKTIVASAPVGFVQKPFSIGTLAIAVRQALDEAAARQPASD